MENMNRKTGIINFVLLQVGFLVLSTAGIFSKLASSYSFMSKPFTLYYGVTIVILACYTILWQQVLKRMKLTTAYYNKSITIIWGMIFGRIIFGEQIKVTMIVGAVIVIIGIIIVISADREQERIRQ